MVNILIATGNLHKFKEIEAIMGNYAGINTIYLDKSFGVDIVEDGETYRQNAKIKADGYIKFIEEHGRLKSELNLDYVASEDSGLEVDCLGGIPGLFTARYAGKNAADIENINKLLDSMKMENCCDENRRAKFICSACLYDIKRSKFHYLDGELNGSIAGEPACGANGFGYDPVFVVSGINKAISQITPAEKNKISHRAIAFNKVAKTVTFFSQMII